MNKVIRSKILLNQEIAAGVFKMKLELPANYPKPQPGQFVNIYLDDASRLLPRPLSVCDWEAGVLTLVYAVAGEGTRILSGYANTVRVSTPLGNGFSSSDKALLIGGGLGVPPMLYLAKSITSARVVLGFRNEAFLGDEFPQTIEIATDDGSTGFKGTVLDLLKSSGVEAGTKIFACGPKPMLKALAVFAKDQNLDIEVSLEERMGCGYGACVGCSCLTINGNRKVCEYGPVFEGSEVVW